jgi:ATP-dependent Lon protease
MELFVFPLGHMLLYPSFSKPFHIYEPRYIQMVEDSIRTGTPIAIGNVFEIEENHEYKFGEPLNFVREIVGFGMPVIVEKSSINGSMVIFLEGKGKARLGSVVDRKTSYIVCEAEALSENHSIGSDKLSTFAVAHKVMVHWMNDHISDPNAREQFLSYVQTPEQVIGCYASYLVADHDLQQYILESNDINEKLDIIGRLIASGELVA